MGADIDGPVRSGEPPRTAIVGAQIFDGDTADMTQDTVVLGDGRIESIGEPLDAPVDRLADRVIDATGCTLIPGLIDAHWHAYGHSLDMADIETVRSSYLALAAVPRLAGALTRGFTTVRDVAGGDAGLAAALDEGLVAGPRYLFTGPALSQTGGHGDPRAATHECACAGHMAEVVDGVDAVQAAVRDRFRHGAHAIKLMTSGGVVSPSDPIRPPQYSCEEVRAACAEAARRGSYVAAHAYSPEAIVHSVTNGVRSVEHGNLLDETTARTMKEHGAFLIPTLATYDAMNRHGERLEMSTEARAKNAEVLDSGCRAIEIAKTAGVEIGFGTDLMGSLESEQLAGLRLQAEVQGILELLRSATSRNARLLGLTDRGRVAPGQLADLVLLPSDPFTDPSVLWTADSRRRVFLAGREVNR